jgi:hypothetical protein
MIIAIPDNENKIKIETNKIGHHKIADLIYHEGPFLALMIDNDTNTFLYKWVGCNDNSNSWLISSVSSQDLLDFFSLRKSLKDLYVESHISIVVDIDDEIEIDLGEITAFNKIPTDYLPKESSLYDENIYTESANTLRNVYLSNLVIATDNKIDVMDYVKSISPDTNIVYVAEAEEV